MEKSMKETVTIQDGKMTSKECCGASIPASFSFKDVNEWVHSPERTYEDLESMCLAQADAFDRLRNFIKWFVFYGVIGSATIIILGMVYQ